MKRLVLLVYFEAYEEGKEQFMAFKEAHAHVTEQNLPELGLQDMSILFKLS